MLYFQPKGGKVELFLGLSQPEEKFNFPSLGFEVYTRLRGHQAIEGVGRDRLPPPPCHLVIVIVLSSLDIQKGHKIKSDKTSDFSIRKNTRFR